jgi:hypothetical protein
MRWRQLDPTSNYALEAAAASYHNCRLLSHSVKVFTSTGDPSSRAHPFLALFLVTVGGGGGGAYGAHPPSAGVEAHTTPCAPLLRM